MTFSEDRLLAESEACLLTRKIGKKVPDVSTPLQVLQQLGVSLPSCAGAGRHKVQRIASERIALNSRCLIRYGCMGTSCTIHMGY